MTRVKAGLLTDGLESAQTQSNDAQDIFLSKIILKRTKVKMFDWLSKFEMNNLLIVWHVSEVTRDHYESNLATNVTKVRNLHVQ